MKIIIAASIFVLLMIFPTSPPAAGRCCMKIIFGYNHGCLDARAGGHSYLDSQSKDSSFNSDEFMQGYNNGYIDCSSSHSGGSSIGSNMPSGSGSR